MTPDAFKLLEPDSPEKFLPDHGLWPWFLGGGVALVLFLIILLTLSFLRRKKLATTPEAIRRVALAKAEKELSNIPLENSREAAVQCSLVLRRYLSAAANDSSLFETHEEFLSRSDSLSELSAESRAAAQESFSKLAALKYAPDFPSTSPDEILAEARSLLLTLHNGFPK